MSASGPWLRDGRGEWLMAQVMAKTVCARARQLAPPEFVGVARRDNMFIAAMRDPDTEIAPARPTQGRGAEIRSSRQQRYPALVRLFSPPLTFRTANAPGRRVRYRWTSPRPITSADTPL